MKKYFKNVQDTFDVEEQEWDKLFSVLRNSQIYSDLYNKDPIIREQAFKDLFKACMSLSIDILQEKNA